MVNTISNAPRWGRSTMLLTVDRTVKELKGPEPTNNELEEIQKEEEQEFLDLESPSKVYH